MNLGLILLQLGKLELKVTSELKITLKVMLHGTIREVEQCCTYSQQCRNNVATLCCAKNRRCESSRVTSP